MHFRAALAEWSVDACPGDCDCATGGVAGTKHEPIWCQWASVNQYLTKVYPMAAWKEEVRSASFFHSLHYVHDRGCATPQQTCRAPGVFLRWLYGSFLPCTAFPVYMQQQLPSSSNISPGCLEQHLLFAPDWATELPRTSHAEVEHRAFGMGVPNDALPDEGRSLPTSAADFC